MQFFFKNSWANSDYSLHSITTKRYDHIVKLFVNICNHASEELSGGLVKVNVKLVCTL